MEELVNLKDKCCGCGLCAVKCPKQAIEIKEDEYGFMYPFIDKSKCINCGICKKVCNYNKKENEKKLYEKKAYAAISKDNSIIVSTASGGVFTTIATSFLYKGGVVFGCSLEKEKNRFTINHVKVTDIKGLEKLKGSKYVQSDISNVFSEIAKELNNKKKVLFSGTPCQVAAIKSFTQNPHNLFTIDLICHGVPSNKMFNDYISYLSNKNNIEIDNFLFRDKKKGWGLYYYYYYYDKKKNQFCQKTSPAFKSSYYQMFLDSYTYRENCYSCPYACDIRVGDITIGDYWGFETEHLELMTRHKINPEKGVSCIIVNSSKGQEILDNYSSDIYLFESKYDKIKLHNQQLNNPSKKQKDREYILENYKENGYQIIEEYYFSRNKIKRLIKGIWYKIPYNLRKKIKK